MKLKMATSIRIKKSKSCKQLGKKNCYWKLSDSFLNFFPDAYHTLDTNFTGDPSTSEAVCFHKDAISL